MPQEQQQFHRSWTDFTATWMHMDEDSHAAASLSCNTNMVKQVLSGSLH